jgi:hypothetical protein
MQTRYVCRYVVRKKISEFKTQSYVGSGLQVSSQVGRFVRRFLHMYQYLNVRQQETYRRVNVWISKEIAT